MSTEFPSKPEIKRDWHVLDGSGLTTHAAARNINGYIELACCFGDLKRLLGNHSMNTVEEILIDCLLVNQDFSSSWSQKYPGYRTFPATRS